MTIARVQQIMGMPVSVHIRAQDTTRLDLAAAVDQVFTHLRRADATLSTWRPDSDVMRWRRGEIVVSQLDPWVHEVMELCDEATDVTGGLFTTDLLGPDGTRGWDPTGLAKGWAVATAAEHLREIDGITFSINAGGDIVCGRGGFSSDTAPWRIGIEDPADRTRIAHVVSVTDGAVATSGASARGAHIVDPRSDTAVNQRGSTTVVGPDLMWADVWATATFIDPSALDDRPEWSEYCLTTTGPV